MARESNRNATATTTPARPNASGSVAERSAVTSRPSIHTPSGLSASGRKPTGVPTPGPGPGPGPALTPHARAAFRTIESRRHAAVLTPHHRARQRRQSAMRGDVARDRERETPRNVLLSLGKVLARTTQVITTSSSSPEEGNSRASANQGQRGDDEAEEDDEDDVDDELPKRPRLSLPIDEEDEEDDADLQPHRSAGLEDDDTNYNDLTVRSIELPRREQPGGTSRFSLGSMGRMSDFYLNNANDLDDVGIDSGFFPPTVPLYDDGDNNTGDISAYERLDSDAALGRRDTIGGRESDFGIIEVPVMDVDEGTFVIAPQVQDSPTRPLPLEEEDDYEAPEPFFYPAGGDDNDDTDDDGNLDKSPDDPRGGVVARSTAEHGQKRKRNVKVSKHGVEYPSLPPAVVKRLAQTFAKTSGVKGKISPDALKAIMQASDWFFEQLGDDLQAYAKHAHRKTIDESDVLTLMKRQRQTGSSATPFSLAQRHLPRELLQELRMAPPPPAPSRRRRKPSSDEAEDAEEVT
ncbi:centromere protein T [Diplogelasinospora grovesii]|uniref:Centromere protein T n=1 Tax=Diplogelasinospora grovesii TaxID=303347 RepID=A0AAN6NE74_9PEZI|nr:centromere protein T [Diplogelasinospora grovesii]